MARKTSKVSHMIIPGIDLYQTDLFIPQYQPMRVGDWALTITPFLLCRGYWSEARGIVNMAALVRHGRTWMSSTPMEMESQEIGIRLSHGHVLIYGMGMGWAAVNCALRPQVSAVTIVEYDGDVLEMHRHLDIFSQLPPEARAKIRILQGDAYEYVPDQPVDLLMPDIWLPLMNDGRVGEVQRMHSKVQAKQVYFWGQEMELARHAVAAGRALDDAGIRATIADFQLPLIGPELPDYADKLSRAAHAWMRGRWLALA